MRLTLYVLFFLSVLLSPFIPHHFGFEGGFYETLQIFVLAIGAAFAYGAIRLDKANSAWMWSAVLILWAVMIGRELSWGAVFLDPYEITPEGPQFSSSLLSYKEILKPVQMVCLALVLFGLIKGKLHTTLIKAWKNKTFPVLQLVGFFGAMVLAAICEGGLLDLKIPNGQILEEIFESAGYLCLLSAQLRLAQLKLSLRPLAAPAQGLPQS